MACTACKIEPLRLTRHYLLLLLAFGPAEVKEVAVSDNVKANDCVRTVELIVCI